MKRFLTALSLFCCVTSAFAGPQLPTVGSEGGGSTSVAKSSEDVDTPVGSTTATNADVPGAQQTPSAMTVSSQFPTLDIISLSRLGMESADLDGLGADTNSKAALQRIALALADPGVANGVNSAIVDARAKTSLVLAARQQMFQLMPMLNANQEVLNRYLKCESDSIKDKNINAFDVVRYCMQVVAPSAAGTGTSAGSAFPTGSATSATGSAESSVQQAIANTVGDEEKNISSDFQCKIDDLEVSEEEANNIKAKYPWVTTTVGKKASVILGQLTSGAPLLTPRVDPSPFQKLFTDYIGDVCVFQDKDGKGSLSQFIAPKITGGSGPYVASAIENGDVTERYMQGVYDNIISLMKLKCLKEYGEPATDKLNFKKTELFPATVYDNYAITTETPSQFWQSNWVNEAWLQRMSFRGFKFGPVIGDALFNEMTHKALLTLQSDWSQAQQTCDQAFSQYDGKFRQILAAFRKAPADRRLEFPDASEVLMKTVGLIAKGRMSSFYLEMTMKLGGPVNPTGLLDNRQMLLTAIQHRAQMTGILEPGKFLSDLPASHMENKQNLEEYIRQIIIEQTQDSGGGVAGLKTAAEAKQNNELTLPY